MHYELHNNVAITRGTAPVAVGTTGTGQVGAIVDRRGYRGVEFIVAYGTVTATNAVFTVTVKEGDVTGTMTSVADADLLGTESAAGLAAAVRVSGTTKIVNKKIGYIGAKRYVQCQVKSTVTAATPIAVVPVLYGPAIVPTT
jgi:hypothetical protein